MLQMCGPHQILSLHHSIHHCLLSDLLSWSFAVLSLQWRQNDHNGVSNHQPHHWLLNRLFRRRSKKTSKLRVTGLCVGNSPGTDEFPAQKASNAENVSILLRHLVIRWSLRVKIISILETWMTLSISSSAIIIWGRSLHYRYFHSTDYRWPMITLTKGH